jgi:hypothetical protein
MTTPLADDPSDAERSPVSSLFGPVYAWLALRPRIDHPLLVVGGLGKRGFFALAAAYWAAGDLPGGTVLQTTPDLVLAAVFLWWAWGASGVEPP